MAEGKRGPGRPRKDARETGDFDELMIPSQEEIDLETFLEEVGPSATMVDVFRVGKTGGRAHVGRTEIQEIADDVYGYIREHFGSGKYLLGFKGGNRGKYLAWKTIAVEGGEVAAAPAASGAAGTALEEHMRFMREQHATQQNLIASLIAGLKPIDLTPLVLAMNNNKAAATTDPAQMLTAVVSAFSVLRGPAKDEDWLTRAKTIIELAQDLKSDKPSDGENVWSVVKEVGKEVVSRLALPPAAGLAASTAPEPAPNPAAQQQGGEVATIAKWITAGLAYLKTKAASGKDPILYVDYIIENREEPQFAALISGIEQGATFEQLLQFDGEIAQNPASVMWFRTLYDGLHSEIFEPVDSAGGGGNASNAPVDETPSDPGPKPTRNKKSR